MEPSAASPGTPAKRVAFVDLLRGWAVIVMIQTHVFNATLLPTLRETGFFDLVKFVDGLVAPSFLFASGMAYAITTRRKLANYLTFGRPLFRQFSRLLFILVIGYVLHIPRFDFQYLLTDALPEEWEKFWQVDVLQCIAVTLLFLQAMLLLLRTERRLYKVVACLGPAVLLLTPIMWTINWWNFLPIPVASYLNGLYYSLFPLFPWSSFLFAGALAGYGYANSRERGGAAEETRVARRWGWWALGLVVGSFVLHPVAERIYPVYDYWRISPSFVMLRLGIVLVLLALLFYVDRRKQGASGSIVALVGRESLIVYTTHLMLIYGDFGGASFADRVGTTLGYGWATLTTVVLLALMVGLAAGWGRIKRGPVRVMRGIQWALLALFLIVFFGGPLLQQ